MIKIIECPLCGSTKLQDFYGGIDRYYSGRQVHCSVCSACSLVFLDPRPSEEEYKEWYESVFQDKRRNYSAVEQVVDNIEEKHKYKNKLKELKYFKDFINKNSRCLEIGAGWGTLARAVKDNFNCEIDVIEPSKLAAKVASEYFHLNAYNETFESFAKRNGQPGKKYDLIYSYHVFEHIREPNLFLDEVKKILNGNGTLLLALPDALHPEVPSERFFHIDHCFYYTRRTLSLMLNKHGFRILKFWQRATDMKAACVRDDSLPRTVFSNSEEREKIRKAVNRFDQRRKILKSIKKIIYFPLTEKQREKANRIAVKLFKK